MLSKAAAIPLIPLSCLIFTAGIGAGYLFDDTSSILPLLQLQSSPELFWELVLNDRSGPLGRPVSIFTFAVEQIWFAAGPDFSQAVSICIHAINALLVFWLGSLIWRATNNSPGMLLPLLVALLWSLAPQKVSSVLYIAQRMTLLATSFILLTLIFYVKARLSCKSNEQLAFVSVAILSAAIAPFAKEIGLLAVPCAAAIELFIFAGYRKKSREALIRNAALGVLILGTIVFIYLGVTEYLRSDITYVNRNFGFADRLLSSPGILIDYIRQFFIPDVLRMGVLHDDYPLLGPLQRPLVFFTSLVVVVGAIAYVVVSAMLRKKGLLAAGLAIFFIGHSLESFFFPLELYFEHRNYFPSLGLALAFVGTAESICKKWKFPRSFSVASPVIYISLMGMLTLYLCLAWRDSSTLLLHHLSGHERSSRANAEMSFLTAKVGDRRRAQTYLTRSIELTATEPAAKPLGGGDHLVLKLVIACLSGQPFAAVDASKITPGDVVVLADANGLHSAAVRALKTAFSQRHCPNADWSLASEMIQSFVVSRLERSLYLDWMILRDLVTLERELGHPLKVFIYSQMAIEMNPADGMLHLAKLEASAILGDADGIQDAMRYLAMLDGQGRLSPMERHLLSIARKSMGVKNTNES